MSTGRPLQEFREGLSFLRKETRAQDLLAFSVMVTFFGISSIIILPAVVSLVLGGGADMLGFLLASSGAGALVGALFLTPLAQRGRRTGSMLAANVVWSGVGLLLFPFPRRVVSSAIGVLLVSLAIPGAAPAPAGHGCAFAKPSRERTRGLRRRGDSRVRSSPGPVASRTNPMPRRRSSRIARRIDSPSR